MLKLGGETAGCLPRTLSQRHREYRHEPLSPFGSHNLSRISNCQTGSPFSLLFSSLLLPLRNMHTQRHFKNQFGNILPLVNSSPSLTHARTHTSPPPKLLQAENITSGSFCHCSLHCFPYGTIARAGSGICHPD